MISNDQFAELLGTYSKLLALHGGNSFQVNAYQSAAFNISKKITTPLYGLSLPDLQEIPALGKSVVGKIAEISASGTFNGLTELLENTPSGVVEMLNVRGLGPKKVQIIWKEMEIDSIAELLNACRENRLAKAKGFGEKTQEQVLAALEFDLTHKDKMHWAKANAIVIQVNMVLSKLVGQNDFCWVGDFYRKVEIVDKLHLVLNVRFKRQLKIALTNIGLDLIEQDTNLFMAYYNGNFPINIEFVENIAWSIYDYSTPEKVKSLLNLREIDAENEQVLFDKNNIPFIIPEVREEENLSWLKEPIAPIIFDDIKGCLHNHTVYSDGLNTLKEMSEACRANGWQYFGVSDHSKTAGYAGGLKEDEVVKQWKEIDQINAQYTDFKIFKGIESDILADGSLDYEEEILKGFDFVVASIHSNLKMEEEKAMMRLIKAIENPYTRILGHPTGRLLLMREGYPVNHKKIIDACAANQVAIELNSHPYRLDMDWRHIHYAIEKGVWISINPDAHVITGLMDMQYGVNVARKGGLSAKECLNALDLEAFEKWIASKN